MVIVTDLNYVKTRYTVLVLSTKLVAVLYAKFELEIQIDNDKKS